RLIIMARARATFKAGSPGAPNRLAATRSLRSGAFWRYHAPLRKASASRLNGWVRPVAAPRNTGVRRDGGIKKRHGVTHHDERAEPRPALCAGGGKHDHRTAAGRGHLPRV